jgi:hypothetical protein
VALAAPALAGDVSVQLDAGAGFSVKNSTGAIERLRVDEATGNVSRNGALFVHTTGTGNLFVGPGAGNTSTSGTGYNAAFGRNALAANGSGFHNTAVGSGALASNTTGGNNAALGTNTLQSNTGGNNNSAFGSFALSNNNNSDNSAFGSGAMFFNSGSSNSAFGRYALRNPTAGQNSAFGAEALRFNSSGSENSAFGMEALYSNSTNGKNSAFGQRALQYSTGTGNTAVGRWALRFNSTGSYNVAIGMNAGENQNTGSNNIYLANMGAAGESGQIKIGRSGVHSAARIFGIRGVTTGVADATSVLIDSTGQLGTINSSRNAKKDIRDMGDATARLLDLRPVTFRYKQAQTLPGGREVPPEYGLIAEEVAEVFPDLVVYDEKGEPFTVKYHELAPMLLNEMKKQQQVISVLSARLEAVEGASRTTRQEEAR